MPADTRPRLIPLLAAAVGFAVGLGWWLVQGNSLISDPAAFDQPTATTLATTESTTAQGVSAVFEAGDAETISAALNSDDVQSLLSVLEPLDGVDMEQVAAEMVPAGTEVLVDPDSFVDFGGGLGAIEVTLSGAVDASAILYLRLVDDEWVITGTSEPVVSP